HQSGRGGVGAFAGLVASVVGLGSGRFFRTSPSYRLPFAILPAKEFEMLSARFWMPLLFCVAAWPAGDVRSSPQAAGLVEQNAGRLPAPLAIEFRMVAAQALQPRYPALARKSIDRTLETLRSGKVSEVRPGVVRALAELAPEDAVSTLPNAAPDSLPILIGALAQTGHTDSALALYRSSLADGKVKVTAVAPLISQFAKQKPAMAATLFQEVVATFSFDHLEPSDAWWLINTASSAASATPGGAADLYERILNAASAPEYGDKSKSSVTATFKIGSETVAAANSRDTLLLAAGFRLQKLAPERFAKFQPVLSRWNLAGPVTLQAFNIRPPGAPSRNPVPPGADVPILKSLTQFRGKPTDADRAKLALEVSAQIRALPDGSRKLDLAQSLCNLSTEGDLGKEALTAVAGTLAQSIHSPTADAHTWLELASLLRYEHLPAPLSDPALDAADSVLALRESLVQEAAFSLIGLDGKTYSLSALRGRVVLVNFWATWCPPCRREMPDMEKLYRSFEKKGLTVLAISDEERDTVTGFLEKQNYTFPVLLDPGRKVNTAFSVEGIPKSFLFDREGKLVAESIDMRTERQFLEMLETAGLEPDPQ
ncbi:MAG TPA: TlpA disulfide reductase family protein, partial [Bryobacteraceae bacterium]